MATAIRQTNSGPVGLIDIIYSSIASTMAPHNKKTIITCVIIFGLLAGFKFFQIRSAIKKHSSFKLPAVAVNSHIVEETPWPQTFSTTADLEAVQGAILSVELPGTVKSINYLPGSQVTAGTTLIQLDTSVEDAQLERALAQEAQARRVMERATKLSKQGVTSSSDFEDAETSLIMTSAELKLIKGTIARKQIIAPFNGTVGIQQINVGDYLQAGTPVVSLYNLEKLFVNMTLPQQFVNQVKLTQKILLSVGEREYSADVTAINPNIDGGTRNFSVQGTLTNRDGTLRPGMYAKATLILNNDIHSLTVPATAINYAPYGDSVFVIKDDNTVEQRVVTLGDTRGNQVGILSGITAGDKIVSSGVFRLRQGMEIKINNEVTPNISITPSVKDS